MMSAEPQQFVNRKYIFLDLFEERVTNWQWMQPIVALQLLKHHWAENSINCSAVSPFPWLKWEINLMGLGLSGKFWTETVNFTYSNSQFDTINRSNFQFDSSQPATHRQPRAVRKEDRLTAMGDCWRCLSQIADKATTCRLVVRTREHWLLLCNRCSFLLLCNNKKIFFLRKAFLLLPLSGRFFLEVFLLLPFSGMIL